MIIDCNGDNCDYDCDDNNNNDDGENETIIWEKLEEDIEI